MFLIKCLVCNAENKIKLKKENRKSSLYFFTDEPRENDRPLVMFYSMRDGEVRVVCSNCGNELEENY